VLIHRFDVLDLDHFEELAVIIAEDDNALT
jgi:hypothetical protein